MLVGVYSIGIGMLFNGFCSQVVFIGFNFGVYYDLYWFSDYDVHLVVVACGWDVSWFSVWGVGCGLLMGYVGIVVGLVQSFH